MMLVVNNTPFSNRWAGNFFLAMFTLVFGLLPTILGLVFANLHTRDWPAVQATVISHDFRGEGRAPIYEYVVNGQAFQYFSDVSSSHPRPIGATRELRVNPENPGDARPYRPAFLWMGLALPVGIGIGLVGKRLFDKNAGFSNQFNNGFPQQSFTENLQDVRISHLEEEIERLKANQR